MGGLSIPGLTPSIKFAGYYPFIQQAPAVQRLDNTIHQARVVHWLDNAIRRMNHYPADSGVGFVNTYPLDSDLSSG